jgi:hypothetical protein
MNLCIDKKKGECVQAGFLYGLELVPLHRSIPPVGLGSSSNYTIRINYYVPWSPEIQTHACISVYVQLYAGLTLPRSSFFVRACHQNISTKQLAF